MTRRQMLATALPVLAVFVASWFFVWGPARSAAATAQDDQRETELLTDIAADDLAFATEFVDDPDAQSELDDLRRAVPESTAMNGFIAVHADIAIGAGVIVSSFVPDLPSADDAVAPTGSTSTGISVTVIGTLPQTLEYLDALSASPRLIVVDSLDVAAETESTLATAVRIRIFDTDVADTDELELDEFGEPINGEFEDATEDDIIAGE